MEALIWFVLGCWILASLIAVGTWTALAGMQTDVAGWRSPK